MFGFRVLASDWKDSPLKKSLTKNDIRGVRAYIESREDVENFFTYLGLIYNKEHGTLDVMETDYSLSFDVLLSHFALTEDGRVVAVGYDMYDREHWYVEE